ncbi:MAG: hypothetical protein WBX25_21790 [Rhodomicrobium sp.]
MAYVAPFSYDIFVSYARNDNETASQELGWVSTLVYNLRIALLQRLGDADNLKIFFDAATLGGNDQLHKLLDSAKKSAIFLAIASPSYAKREWTQLELKAFVAETSDLSRLFALERLRLAEGERYPEPLDKQNRLSFWQKLEIDSLGEDDIPLEPKSDLFKTKINRLASQMANKLRELSELKTGATKKEAPLAPAIPQPFEPKTGRAVLLAQVTEDLELEREELKSYLEQYEYRVIPEQTYPQGADAFSRAFSKDAAEAELIIQLLGPAEGRIPSDLKVSYPRYQAEIVASMEKPCLRWRRPDLQLSQVRNTAYRSLLQDATVTVSGFEAFKSEVLARLAKDSGQKPAQPDAMIFINADDDDLDLAKNLQARLEKQQLSSILPMRNGQATDIRTDLEENYTDCDIVVFIYGSASPSWVRGQLRLFNKVRGRRQKPPRAIAILIGPPFDKPELGITYPGASEIVARDDLAGALVRDLLLKIKN